MGRVRRPHGIHGEVAVEIVTDFPERLVAGVEVGIGRESPEFHRSCDQVRSHKGAWLLSFVGIRDRDEVEGWRGLWLFLPAQERSQLPENYYYEHELVGCRCRLADGAALGEVTELQTGPGGALLVVATARGEVLVPFVSADRRAGRPRRPRRSCSTRRAACSTAMRCDVLTLFPAAVEPYLAVGVLGRGRGSRHPRRAGARPAEVGDQPLRAGGRRALRRRTRDGAHGPGGGPRGARGRGARRRAPRRAPRRRAGAGSTTRSPASWPATTACSSCAGATRVSTSAFTSSCARTRSRSATSCSRAASWRRSRCSTRPPATFPGSSATPARWPRTPSPRGCSTTRCSRGRASSRA